MPHPQCPFCRQPAGWAQVPRFVYSQAGCACGALGVWFGIPADSDEGADQLLAALAIDERVALPPQPVGSSGMLSAVAYDTDATTRGLHRVLESRGYQMSLVEDRTPSGGPSWAFWARAARSALLATPRLVMRDLEESDAAGVNAWESDPEVVRFQSTDVGTVEDSLAYIRRVRAESMLEPRLLYQLGVLRRDDELLLGRVGLRVLRPEHREAEIWYVFRRDVWGQGYAREAVGALLDHGFSALGLHRIYGDCDPRNTRSAQVMEKLGMQREAHLRENWWLKGEWCDSWIFSILDREWAARRPA
jgi:RimJ/RimL family protein N-acetyltransferase